MPALRDGVVRRGRTWSYVIRAVDPQTGRSRPRWVGGFVTEAEAKAARDVARVAARRGEFVDRNRVTVAEFLASWLAGHALTVKPKTLAGYRFLVDSYVVPHIGSMRLQAVRASTLSGLYRQLLDGGGRGGRPLSTRTVEYTHAVLRKAFNDAVHVDQLLPSNPAVRAKRPKAARKEPGVMWSADELWTFLEVVAGHRLAAFYRLAAYSGARRGELLNLRWADLDLDARVMHIRGSVGIVDGQRVEGTTKSGRERRVSLDPGTVEAMRAHRHRQRAERLVAGEFWMTGDHVFRTALGEPLFPDTVSQLMAKLIRGHNEQVEASPEHGRSLPPIRLHDLRHVHATMLLQAAVPVHVVAARLGHADPAVTLRVYAHVLEDQASEVAAVFARAVETRVPLAPERDSDGRQDPAC